MMTTFDNILEAEKLNILCFSLKLDKYWGTVEENSPRYLEVMGSSLSPAVQRSSIRLVTFESLHMSIISQVLANKSTWKIVDVPAACISP